MPEESADQGQEDHHLSETLVDTKRVSEAEDIREFGDFLSTGMHNKWVDIRWKDLGAFDYEGVRLVVEWRFEEVDSDD